MDNDKLICPITLEEIKVAGITSFGSIYEYSVIEDWLTNNCVDPLTNLPLPTKFVVKMENVSREQIVEQSKHIRLSTSLWLPTYKILCEAPAIYERLSELKKDLSSEEWERYSSHKSNQLNKYKDAIAYLNFYSNKENLDEEDTIERPKNSGCRFQFIRIESKFIQQKNFKSELFDFAHFKNCIFYKCDFSRTSFVGTVFDGVYFRHCKFTGEETSFYKSTIGRHLVFNNCNFEFVDSWKRTTDINEIKQILKTRMLEGDYSVENTLFYNL